MLQIICKEREEVRDPVRNQIIASKQICFTVPDAYPLKDKLKERNHEQILFQRGNWYLKNNDAMQPIRQSLISSTGSSVTITRPFRSLGIIVEVKF